MPSFSRGDVVRVPFPYTDGMTDQRRPALVVSDGALGDGLLLWVLMITSAENRPWPSDVPLAEERRAGLPAPSVVRTLKVATIEAGRAEAIGSISARAMKAVEQELRDHLRLA